MSTKPLEMIVQCPGCSTRFKLHGDRVKGESATMRCTRCQLIFSMRRPGGPAQEEAPTPLPREIARATSAQDTFPVRPSEEPPQDERPPPLPREEVMGPSPTRARRRLWLPVLLVVMLMTSAAIALWLLFPWSHARQAVPDNAGIHLLHLVETQGYFVDNQQAGQLFVIEGRVRNDFASARRWILLRAKLYTTDGQEARQQLFYAGNLLSTEQLRGLPLADQLGLIQQTPQAPQVAIAAGHEVSFIVPFGDLPDISKLSDYSVEIVASQSS